MTFGNMLPNGIICEMTSGAWQLGLGKYSVSGFLRNDKWGVAVGT